MITREEYELLKEYRRLGYKWIARDGDDERVYVYKIKPRKLGLSWGTVLGCYRWSGNDDSLAFIKWEDEKPTRIDDLIRDYESHVEKEKQFILKFSNGQYLYSCDLGMTDEALGCKLTKAEIEAVDPRLMQFAEEVE